MQSSISDAVGGGEFQDVCQMFDLAAAVLAGKDTTACPVLHSIESKQVF